MTRILSVNTGSSSVKLALFDREGAGPVPVRSAKLESGEGGPPAGRLLADFLAGAAVDAVAHRVVHGGDRLVAPCRIDEAVEAEIEQLAELAPLHNPVALRWIRACREHLGQQTLQVACFDTGFYAGLPAEASTYALPAELTQRLRLRRYGFHGLAHQALEEDWRQRSGARGGRVISLQLGSGCSITAMRDGRAVDTSMGFSPLEGLVMATRSGDLDPGLLLHLLGPGGLDASGVADLLNHRSGLLGVSGRSADLRDLIDADDAPARLAVELYCYRARKYVGAYLAVLGGVDAVLFGGGVGENQPEIRRRILEPLAVFGVELDGPVNQATRGVAAKISPARSGVGVWVLPVDEARLLARAADQLLGR